MGFNTWVDLVIINMIDFDIIFDMNVLAPYYFVLNCSTKFITLEILGREN